MQRSLRSRGLQKELLTNQATFSHLPASSGFHLPNKGFGIDALRHARLFKTFRTWRLIHILSLLISCIPFSLAFARGPSMTKKGGISWQEGVCGRGSAGQTTDVPALETESHKLKQESAMPGGRGGAGGSTGRLEDPPREAGR